MKLRSRRNAIRNYRVNSGTIIPSPLRGTADLLVTTDCRCRVEPEPDTKCERPRKMREIGDGEMFTNACGKNYPVSIGGREKTALTEKK